VSESGLKPVQAFNPRATLHLVKSHFTHKRDLFSEREQGSGALKNHFQRSASTRVEKFFQKFGIKVNNPALPGWVSSSKTFLPSLRSGLPFIPTLPDGPAGRFDNFTCFYLYQIPCELRPLGRDLKTVPILQGGN